MATEVIRHRKPAFQHRKFGDPDVNVDLELSHPYVPHIVHSVSYHKDALVGLTVKIERRKVGTSPVIIKEQAMGAADKDFFFEVDTELQHEESLRVFTEGVVFIAAQFHEATIEWSERTELH